MTVGQLQRLLDRLLLVSTQRWLLIAASVGCVAGASTTATLVASSPPGVVIALMVGLSLAAVVRPDSHSALVVEVALVWQWLALNDDLTTLWVVPFALLLFGFHCTVALMAITPIAAHVDAAVLRRWIARSGSVAVATFAVWAIAWLMDQRPESASTALTAGGFLTLAVLVVVMRERSAPPRV